MKSLILFTIIFLVGCGSSVKRERVDPKLGDYARSFIREYNQVQGDDKIVAQKVERVRDFGGGVQSVSVWVTFAGVVRHYSCKIDVTFRDGTPEPEPIEDYCK